MSIKQRLYINRKSNTATIIFYCGGNNPTKYAELEWICETEKDFDKVISIYPNAEIINEMNEA